MFIYKEKRKFGSLEGIREYIDILDDSKLGMMLELALSMQLGSIEGLIEQVRDCYVDSKNVLFTTIHKAKGLEWDRVRLADDFGVL